MHLPVQMKRKPGGPQATVPQATLPQATLPQLYSPKIKIDTDKIINHLGCSAVGLLARTALDMDVIGRQHLPPGPKILDANHPPTLAPSCCWPSRRTRPTSWSPLPKKQLEA